MHPGREPIYGPVRVFFLYFRHVYFSDLQKSLQIEGRLLRGIGMIDSSSGGDITPIREEAQLWQ